jgi:hypothetical protein
MENPSSVCQMSAAVYHGRLSVLFSTSVQLLRPDHSQLPVPILVETVARIRSQLSGSNPAVWKHLSCHIVTLTLASCALQLIHLTPRPAVFSFDNLAIPNGVHSLVVDAPRFFHSIECGIFFQHYTRPRCAAVLVLGVRDPRAAFQCLVNRTSPVPSSAAISLVSRRNTVISPSSTISLVQ